MADYKQCQACRKDIWWDDEIYKLPNGNVYHEKCVDAFPITVALFTKTDGLFMGESLGEHDGDTSVAYGILPEGTYKDLDREEE